MKNIKIDNGWLEVDLDNFWVHYKDSKWTGLTIAQIPPWPPENPLNIGTVFHARFYPQDGNNRDCDIESAPTLEQAKTLAENYYGSLKK